MISDILYNSNQKSQLSSHEMHGPNSRWEEEKSMTVVREEIYIVSIFYLWNALTIEINGEDLIKLVLKIILSWSPIWIYVR